MVDPLLFKEESSTLNFILCSLFRHALIIQIKLQLTKLSTSYKEEIFSQNSHENLSFKNIPIMKNPNLQVTLDATSFIKYPKHIQPQFYDSNTNPVHHMFIHEQKIIFDKNKRKLIQDEKVKKNEFDCSLK